MFLSCFVQFRPVLSSLLTPDLTTTKSIGDAWYRAIPRLERRAPRPARAFNSSSDSLRPTVAASDRPALRNAHACDLFHRTAIVDRASLVLVGRHEPSEAASPSESPIRYTTSISGGQCTAAGPSGGPERTRRHGPIRPYLLRVTDEQDSKPTLIAACLSRICSPLRQALRTHAQARTDAGRCSRPPYDAQVTFT